MRWQTRRALAAGLAVLALGTAAGGCGWDGPTLPDVASDAGQSWAVDAATVAAAQRDLDTLVLAPRSAGDSYDREAFGDGWGLRGGCRTREVVLAQQLQRVGRDGCDVVAGELVDPYTGRTLRYDERLPGGGIDIDHVVPLRHAWQAGAATWPPHRREAFANDPRELQATSVAVNRDKGSAPVDGWLPPNRSYRCRYAVRWVAIKKAWGLTVTAPERATLDRELGRCPRMPDPADRR